MRLTLRILRSLPRFSQPYFLSLYFPIVSSQKSNCSQVLSKVLVVVQQRSGNTMSNCTRLTRTTSASDGDVQIGAVLHIRNFQRLANNHTCCFATEVFVDWLLIH